MSEQQLREMFAYASGFCKKRFAARGEIAPMWHAVTAQGEHIMVPPPGPNKDASVALIRALFEIRGVVRYIFMDEAWILKADTAIPADEMARIDRDGLSDHPRRVEVVMLTGEDSACGMMMAYRLIIRPKNGKPRLGPLEWTMEPGGPGVDHSEGRMVGLLPVRGMQQ